MTEDPRQISSQDAQRLLDAHKESRCWRAERGYGTFLRIDFGNPVRKRRRDGTHYFTGSYHLWVYMAEWEVVSGSQVLVRWKDDPIRVDPILPRLITSSLLNVEELALSDLRLSFTRGLSLSLRSMSEDNDADLFMLFFPDGVVLSYNRSLRFYLTGGREELVGS